jgi:4-amino-4-deoxy-L-arabinose transferase-like glycosyltransferase
MGDPSATQQATEIRLFFIATSGLLLVAYVLGLLVFPMDIDSAQYAAMSMEMWQNQSFLEITNLGKPYLDKPPLIFWLSSCSMGVFGFHPWSFKLPTFLSTVLGFYSIYRLTQRLWNQDAAQKAFLMLASSVAWLIFNNDVRTDALLANFVIFSSWQFVEWYVRRKYIHILGIAVGIALAMLAKGPIGAVAVGVWGASWLIFHRDWKSIFNVRWIVLALLVILLLIPMCWGLYKQHGWEGIRFYFWTQSFGRVTGESEWVNHPGLGYFFPVLAWSFLPWTPFLVWGSIVSIMKKNEWGPANKALLVSGLVLFAALSLSRYKLPHYIFIILPWLSVLTARWISLNNHLLVKHFFFVYPWISMSLMAILIPSIFPVFFTHRSFDFLDILGFYDRSDHF